ncbi:helix-turn-helix domain-containing protein [Caulobacter segnis]|uniref:helix-turn-helix domain-containing protein n=1 Tax=Caulobacter segnis TaxID=88688 RepID=UPI0038575361
MQDQRLWRARALMTEQEVSVIEAALQVGYANPSHFARLYRRAFGVSPSRAIRQGGRAWKRGLRRAVSRTPQGLSRGRER